MIKLNISNVSKAILIFYYNVQWNISVQDCNSTCYSQAEEIPTNSKNQMLGSREFEIKDDKIVVNLFLQIKYSLSVI